MRVAGVIGVDANIFRNIAKSNLGKMITPPTASTTNGRLRKCMPFVTAREFVQELFSTGNGILPVTGLCAKRSCYCTWAPR